MPHPPPFDPAAVDAVVFDVGGVFVYPDAELVRAEARRRGWLGELTDDALRRAHHAAARALTDAGGSVDEASADFWAVYDRRFRAELGLHGEDHHDLEVALRVMWNWPHPRNIAALHRLAATGIPLAVVTNNDGSAAEQLATAGVCQVGAGPLPSVAVIVDSAEAGVAKPDPAIFALAVDVLRTAPERTLYVGDTVHADVVGARAAGLQVVQLDPFDHHGDFDHDRVRDLDELVDILVAAGPR